MTDDAQMKAVPDVEGISNAAWVNRRGFVRQLTFAGTAGLVRFAPREASAERPPESPRLRRWPRPALPELPGWRQDSLEHMVREFHAPVIQSVPWAMIADDESRWPPSRGRSSSPATPAGRAEGP